jgi:hypothetical protein
VLAQLPDKILSADKPLAVLTVMFDILQIFNAERNQTAASPATNKSCAGANKPISQTDLRRGDGRPGIATPTTSDDAWVSVKWLHHDNLRLHHYHWLPRLCHHGRLCVRIHWLSNNLRLCHGLPDYLPLHHGLPSYLPLHRNANDLCLYDGLTNWIGHTFLGEI